MRLSLLSGGGVRIEAPAKVNLFLEILGLREDGYHEIDTIIQAVSLFDTLEFRPAPRGTERLEVRSDRGDGDPLPSGDFSALEENLVVRAARLLESALAPGRLSRAGLSVRLTKRIPMGAGLGGGSSDAAATLLALSSLWGLRPARSELLDLAGRLGSDVGFFIEGGAARCQGRGEKVTPLARDGEGGPDDFVLVYPAIHLSTPLIYKELDRMDGLRPGLTSPSPIATMSPRSIWAGLRSGKLFHNRLEAAARRVSSRIQELLDIMKSEPFQAVLLSGSGSTVYGVCRSPGEAQDLSRRLRDRVPGDFKAEIHTVRSEPRDSFLPEGSFLPERPFPPEEPPG